MKIKYVKAMGACTIIGLELQIAKREENFPFQNRKKSFKK
jgi:hypothetical protein